MKVSTNIKCGMLEFLVKNADLKDCTFQVAKVIGNFSLEEIMLIHKYNNEISRYFNGHITIYELLKAVMDEEEK